MEMWERMRLILGVWLLSSAAACAFNVYFEYREKHFHICDPAKAGSTSLSNTMYLAMSGGQKFPDHCNQRHQFVMRFKCGWDKIPTFKVLLFSADATFTPYPKRLPFVNYSMIIVRDPLHRIVSSWKSKIRPALCVSETDTKIDTDYQIGILAKQGKNMTFVSFTQFVLNHLHLNEWKNAHWDPQIEICGSPYHYQTRLKLEELNETAFNDLSLATGVTMKLEHLHSSAHESNKTRGFRESNASYRPHDKLLDLTLDKIYNYYDDDYSYYGYIQNRTADVAFLAKEFSQFPEECF